MKKLTQNTFIYVFVLCLLVVLLPVGMLADDLLGGVVVVEQKSEADSPPPEVTSTEEPATNETPEEKTSAEEPASSGTPPQATSSSEPAPTEPPSAPEVPAETSSAPPHVTTSTEPQESSSTGSTSSGSNVVLPTPSVSDDLPGESAPEPELAPPPETELLGSDASQKPGENTPPLEEEPVAEIALTLELPAETVPTVESLRTQISALTDDSSTDSVAAVRNQFIAYPEIARQLDRSSIEKLDRLYKNQVTIEITSGVSTLPPDQISLSGAALYADTGKTLTFAASNYTGPALVQPSRCELLGGAFDLSMLINGAVPALATQVKVTLPVPSGASPSRLVLLHYRSNGTEIIMPEYDTASRTATFFTNSFSPFGFANRQTSTSDSTGEPASVTLAREAYDYWCDIRDDIKDSYRGQTFYADAFDYKANVPTVVLEALKGRNATLEIYYKGGSLKINGKKMHPIEKDRVYYTISKLCELYEKPPKPLRPAPVEVFTTPPTIVGTLTLAPALSSAPASAVSSETSSSEESSKEEPAMQTVQTVQQPPVAAPPAPENYSLWIIISISSVVIAAISLVICICTLQTVRKRF